MKITYFQRTIGACDFYRAIQPLTWVGMQMPQHRVKAITSGELAVAIDNDDSAILRRILEADVIVLPRLWGRHVFDSARSLNPRAKIVLEYDDNLFDVSPFNPSYKDHGVEDVEIVHEGQKIKMWEGGKNIDLVTNRKNYAETLDMLKEADLVTTTGKVLADKFRMWNPNVAILPNCVDLRKWQKLPLHPHRGLRMGWFGGHSHYEDWTLLTDVLPTVMERFPDVTLVIMGHVFEGTLKKIPKDRIEFHPWEETPAYPYKAAILDLDLAIIPLRETAFNECKSTIKLVEMGALKVPAVISYVNPYKEIATEHNGMWIEDNSPSAWITGITKMLEDPLLRSMTGLEARRTVEAGFDIAKKYRLWADAYEGVLNGRTDSPDLIHAGK